MKKVYTDEEMELYSKNPKVLYICRNRLTLSLGFRRELYAAWVENPKPSTVKKILMDNGFDVRSIGRNFCRNIDLAFSRSGEPKFSKPPAHDAKEIRYGTSYRTPDEAGISGTGSSEASGEDRKKLTDSGKFVKSGKGIRLSPEFEGELLEGFPDVSIIQGIRNAGFNPKAVGYYIIRKLEKKALEVAKGRCAVPDIPEPEERTGDGEGFRRTPGQVEELLSNPYIERVDEESIILTDRFYGYASILQGLAIGEILGVFFIEQSLLSGAEKSVISERLRSADPTSMDEAFKDGTVFDACVLRRRERALERLVGEGFLKLAGDLPAMTRLQKKRICLWIEGLPRDPGHRYSKAAIIRKLGITRSVYYLYVRDGDFGLGDVRKAEADTRDAQTIQMVFEYRGFRKGSRLVYMLLPRLTGQKMGLKRIRRIMKANGMDSGIRGPNEARRRARSQLDGAIRPNLLRRRFRLHRPNTVRVTDVTCLDYGNGKRAYGSALMDPVTERLLAFVVSENNDLVLALDTLRESDNHPCEDGGIFHSDMGVLYRAGDFQKEVLERGLGQSMSKKGNCWDNATQESFFGHFKDECDYAQCEDIEALKKGLRNTGITTIMRGACGTGGA